MLFLAIVALQRWAAALDLPELAARASPSVVLLTVHGTLGRTEGLGTGFFVSRDGWIVTNHHVVDGATRVTAKTADGTVRDVAGVYADDATNDIAILKLDQAGLLALPLGSSRAVKPGDEIVVIGSPKGLSGTLSAGIISAIRERGPELRPIDPQEVQSWGLQITAAISPGSSGSPVLDRNGQVVGVAVGQMVAGQNLNFAVPIDVVNTMLERLGDSPKLQPFGYGSRSQVVRNLLISGGVFGAMALATLLWVRYDRRKARRATTGQRRDLS